MGNPGATGATGPQGPAGATGATGPSGSLSAGVNNNDILAWNSTGDNWVAKSISIGITGGNIPFSIMQPYLTLNYCIALTGIFPERSGDDQYIGEIDLYPYNFAPLDWNFCDGTTLSISTYPALFSLLGTTYGGNGTTTFQLPDLRGRVAISSGQGPGLTDRILGAAAGAENATLNINNLPSHTHTIVFGAP